MSNHNQTYGIANQIAPELDVEQWIDANGVKTDAIKLKDFEGQFKVVYCFQAWCPGCHSHGFPALQKMVDAMAGSDKVAFLVIQTVFEGESENTFEKLVETQKRYNLKIPFGHDVGSAQTDNRSSTMYHYRSGGTPWFILIDQSNRVIFNDFQLDADKAIAHFKTL